MYEILIAGLAIGGILLLMWYALSKTMRGTPGPHTRPNIYDESYFPGMPGSSAGPLPIGNKRERRNRR